MTNLNVDPGLRQGQEFGDELPVAARAVLVLAHLVGQGFKEALRMLPDQPSTAVSEHMNHSRNNDPNPHFEGRVV